MVVTNADALLAKNGLASKETRCILFLFSFKLICFVFERELVGEVSNTSAEEVDDDMNNTTDLLVYI